MNNIRQFLLVLAFFFSVVLRATEELQLSNLIKERNYYSALDLVDNMGKIDFSFRDGSNDSLLNIAIVCQPTQTIAKELRIQFLARLLELGANPNEIGAEEISIMAAACNVCDVRAVSVLLAYGADMSLYNECDVIRNPITIALTNYIQENNKNNLLMLELLIRSGISIPRLDKDRALELKMESFLEELNPNFSEVDCQTIQKLFSDDSVASLREKGLSNLCSEIAHLPLPLPAESRKFQSYSREIERMHRVKSRGKKERRSFEEYESNLIKQLQK